MSSTQTIAAQIYELVRNENMPEGSHLPAQMLADRLRVSRSPVNQALQLLHDKGMLARLPNRGYFLAKSWADGDAQERTDLDLGADNTVNDIYFQIAEDLLQHRLPLEVTETALKARYDLTAAQLTAVLGRISQEGWIERKPGYGWSFSSMLTTPDSLLQSYRLRLALEPAALLEPGYSLDPAVLARCRAAEIHLLEGGIETDSADQIHDRGVRFHESLVVASRNPFFIETIKRVNRVRRLLSYRSMKDRHRYEEHCRQHLHILDLLEKQRTKEASVALRNHLSSTLLNLERISKLLES
jgi:DNA-binding GntR family transcriptional regulator